MKFPHVICRCIPQRVIVSIECFICLTLSYMMRFCLSIAITEMTTIFGAKEDPHSCPYPDKKKNEEQKKNMEFKWTAKQQGIIHSGLFWGYFTTQILGGVLSDLFNHKTVLLCGFFTSGAATIVTPIMTKLFDWPALLVCRIILGLAQGIFYNSLHAVTAHWIPIEERGILGTLVFSGVQFGNALNSLLTGLITAYLGWPVVFYSYGTVSILWGIYYFFSTYTNPSDFPGLNEKEQKVFDDYHKYVASTQVHKKVPVKPILSNIHVWAIVLAMFGQDWALYSLVTFIPTYLKSVLHFDVQENGIFNAIAFILLWIIGMLCGAFSDYVEKKKWISLTWNRRILYLIGSVFPALGYICVSYVECDRTLAVVFLIIGLSTLGFFYPSVKVNPMDLSPNFAGTVGSIGQMGGCTAGVIVPFLFGLLVPNSYKEEWRVAFWISFAVILFGGISFFLLASGEIQPFNELGEGDQKEEVKG